MKRVAIVVLAALACSPLHAQQPLAIDASERLKALW